MILRETLLRRCQSVNVSRFLKWPKSTNYCKVHLDVTVMSEKDRWKRCVSRFHPKEYYDWADIHVYDSVWQMCSKYEVQRPERFGRTGGATISIWAAISQWVWGQKSPSGVYGRNPGKGSWGLRHPPEDEAVCRHCLHILTAEKP